MHSSDQDPLLDAISDERYHWDKHAQGVSGFVWFCMIWLAQGTADTWGGAVFVFFMVSFVSWLLYKCYSPLGFFRRPMPIYKL